jgi:hypothetical protein
MAYSSWASSTANRACQVWAVQNFQPDRLFQVARLGGAKVVVKNHQIGVDHRGHSGQLLDLAVTEIGGRVGRVAPLGQFSDHADARRSSQSLQLLQPLRLPIRQQHADQNGRLTSHALATIQLVH